VVGGVGALNGETASPGCRLAALCRADAGTWEFSAGGTCPLLISTHCLIMFQSSAPGESLCVWL